LAAGFGFVNLSPTDDANRRLPGEIMKPQVLEREVAHRGYLTVQRLKVRLPDGAEVWREVESHGDSVAVLPYDARSGQALLVQLFRLPIQEACGLDTSLEACAGMVEDETPETATRREAMEEMGVRLGALEFVARLWPSPGVCTERTTLFLAPYSSTERVSAGGGVEAEHEGITVVEKPLSALAAEADKGEITDGKLFTLVLALRLRRPELFSPV
jgi:nudix-type nucleoside diphosphatase (YffH/AdpP family)